MFVGVVDEIPGFEPPVDAWGFKGYTEYHYVAATGAYMFIEIARDLALLASIADAVIIVLKYRSWRKHNVLPVSNSD